MDQVQLLKETLSAYKNGCNFLSGVVFETKNLVQAKLHKVTYGELRSVYNLRSQMAQSVMKTVIARYKSAQSNVNVIVGIL
jgi:hypothetical protein